MSHKRGRNRFSGRFDIFGIEDEDGGGGEDPITSRVAVLAKSFRMDTSDVNGRAVYEAAQAIHEQIKGSQLAVIPGCYHQTPIEAPDAFNRTVDTFLAKLG